MVENCKVPRIESRVLLLHDNHFEIKDGVPSFNGSTFHLLLAGFKGMAHLTSPSLQWDGKSDFINIDGAVIRPRHGYGRAQDFYRSFLRNGLRSFREIYQILGDYDAIMIAGPCCTAPFAHAAAWIRRKPVIAYVIGNSQKVVEAAIEYKGLRRVFARLAARWEWSAILRIARHHQTIVLGEDLKKNLNGNSKALTLGFTSLVRERNIVTSKAFPAGKSLSLLTVGRVSQEKGIEWVLRALAELKLRDIPVRYTVVGAGPDEERLRKLAEKIGVDEMVVFAGARPFNELEKQYQLADIFILPSKTEGVAKVLLEAMAARLAVVATSVGGNPWVLDGGNRGMLVPYGDAKAIAEAVLKLANDAEAREVLLERATGFIREHTLEASARLIMNTIQAERGL